MRKYLAVFRIGFLDAVEYRVEFFVSVFSWGIRLLIALFLWFAVAKTTGRVGPYTFSTILTYFFLTQIISSLVFSRVAFVISQDIHYGDFSNYLTKPISYLFFRLAGEMTQNLFRTMIGILIFGAALAFIQPDFLPSLAAHPWHILLFLFALIASYLINFCVVCMIALLSFWIISAHRLTFMYFGILTIFSGLLLPLDLFPQPLYDFLRFTPLPYIFFFPTKILAGFPDFVWIWRSVIIPEIIFLVVLPIMLIGLYRLGLRRFEAVGR